MMERVRKYSPALGALAIFASLLHPDVARAAEEMSAKTAADTIWVITAAALVFLMQAGFLVFELGLVRTKNTAVVALKNVGDWAVVSIAFLVVGYGVMFGMSSGGWFGTNFFMAEGVETAQAAEGGATHLGWTFVLFQLAFCGTAATIVSGAMAERTGFKAYLLFALVMGAVIYPVYGHWAWGSLFLGAGNEGWLEAMGFHDFAGSSVVHAVGAWASLVGVWIVGPRLGRYGMDGRLNRMDCNSLAWSAFGTLILWFGWWGFNGGSGLSASADVAKIIFNTNLAAAAAGIVGFAHGAAIQGRKNLEEKMLGSILGGLVAITACCDVVSPMGALAVGAIAAPIHNIGFELVIRRWRLDDVVGAVPVHGFCGVWGCLAVAIFGDLGPEASRVEQLGVQALGCAVSFLWVGGVSLITFKVLKATVGIRVDPMAEIEGISLSARDDDDVEHGAAVGEAAAEMGLEADMDALMAEIREHVQEGDKVDAF